MYSGPRGSRWTLVAGRRSGEQGGSESERSYKGVKVKLELEEYLQFTVGKTKAALMEMRSGANDLEIELGRRRRVGVAERICAECRGGVEDEMHLVGTTQRGGCTCSWGLQGGEVELSHGWLWEAQVEDSRSRGGQDAGGEEKAAGGERRNRVIGTMALGAR